MGVDTVRRSCEVPHTSDVGAILIKKEVRGGLIFPDKAKES